MKKALFILLLFSVNLGFSQITSDIFNSKSITFYGLDFTEAKCIGPSQFPGGEEMVNIYFQQWNDLFMKGKKRIKIGAPYKKKEVSYDTTVFDFNRQVDAAALIIDKPYTLKKSKIDGIIEKYADKTKSGIGLVYVIEALNAKQEYLSVWITFFNQSTGEVLLTEPARNVGKGKEIYDYWRVAFIKLYASSGDDYKNWKKIYD